MGEVTRPSAVERGVVTQLLRFVSESSEHVYNDTIFDATERLVFHPQQRWLRSVHYLWPGVPRRHHGRVIVSRYMTRRTRYQFRYKTRAAGVPGPKSGRRTGGR